MLVITLSFGVFGCMLAHHLAGRSLKKNWRVGVGVARALVVVAPDRLPSVEGSLHDSDRLGLSVVAWLNGSELAVRSVDVGDTGGGWVPFAVECGPDPVDSILSAVDAMDADIVILADTSSLESWAFRDLSWALHERGVALAVEPAVGDVALSRMAMSQLNGTSLLQIDEPAYNRAMNLHKRLFDIVVSMMAMVLLSPVMISVALMVKLGDRGPILYGANRVGVGGKPMKMWKFRSMVTDAEARLKEVRAARGLDDDAFFKAEDDPRITRIGRVIRKTSIDELPQLFNVLKGGDEHRRSAADGRRGGLAVCELRRTASSRATGYDRTVAGVGSLGHHRRRTGEARPHVRGKLVDDRRSRDHRQDIHLGLANGWSLLTSRADGTAPVGWCGSIGVACAVVVSLRSKSSPEE
ncbi:hypothetical protein GCM10011489_38100 [Gordonia jinhuaensis]|uniref:Bacterial sugar transferase domain-containing protein n=1 Tax=Gordonia jinhuaensis TaxID=1517702 RepID=A0A916X1J8_9ACTN|nr:hypothetical protein GCM10011489_38100 [Gordonia jinhuaensis]